MREVIGPFTPLVTCSPVVAFSAGLLRTARDAGSGFSATPERIRSYMYQLLCGLAHCHAKGWVHRDIKTANLLVTSKNVLSIADFGLAKQEVPGKNTPLVVTLWYRSPELLYQDPNASFPLDVWSAGCVFGELLTGRELFCGEDSASQIQMIYKLCGVPDTDGWPDILKRIVRPRGARVSRGSRVWGRGSPVAQVRGPCLRRVPPRRATISCDRGRPLRLSSRLAFRGESAGHSYPGGAGPSPARLQLTPLARLAWR